MSRHSHCRGGGDQGGDESTMIALSHCLGRWAVLQRRIGPAEATAARQSKEIRKSKVTGKLTLKRFVHTHRCIHMQKNVNVTLGKKKKKAMIENSSSNNIPFLNFFKVIYSPFLYS